MGSGTLACVVKEGVKLYFYNIRAAHVERARNHAIGSALVDAMSQVMLAKDSAKHAQKEGAKAAKSASRQSKRIIGAIISSGCDFFEAMYYGGTITVGFLRGNGTLFSTYAGGFMGEKRLGRFGYLVGSHLGSWVGGRIGLMFYDVVNGVHFMLNFVQTVGSEFKILPIMRVLKPPRVPILRKLQRMTSLRVLMSPVLLNPMPQKKPMPMNLLAIRARKHAKISNCDEFF